MFKLLFREDSHKEVQNEAIHANIKLVDVGDDTLLHIFDFAIGVESHSTIINLIHTCTIFNRVLHKKLTKLIVPASSLSDKILDQSTSNVLLDDNWEECVIIPETKQLQLHDHDDETKTKTKTKDADCPQNHGLTKSQCKSSNDYLCDECDKEIIKNNFMHSCRICDYDLCHHCFFTISESLVSLCVYDEWSSIM